jgi:hypothetical protein
MVDVQKPEFLRDVLQAGKSGRVEFMSKAILQLLNLKGFY